MWLCRDGAADPTRPEEYDRVELPSKGLWPLRIEVQGTSQDGAVFLVPIFSVSDSLPRDERGLDERSVRWQHGSLTESLAGALVRRPGAPPHLASPRLN